MSFSQKAWRKFFLRLYGKKNIRLFSITSVASVILSNTIWLFVYFSFSLNSESLMIGIYFATLTTILFLVIMYYVLYGAFAEIDNLKRIAIIDQLTLLYNSRHFQDVFTREYRRVVRSNDGQLTLALFEVDNFQHFVSSNNLETQDNAIIDITEIFKNTLKRSSDFIFRMDDDRIAIIFSSVSKERSEVFCTMIKDSIAELNVPYEKNGDKTLTASVGIAYYEKLYSRNVNKETIYNYAIQSLEEARQLGGDIVVMSS